MDLRFVYFLTVLGLAQSSLVNLKCKGIKKFVNGHNWRRQLLAQGKVAGQPPASKMNALIWDNELAAKAAKWASRNKYGHNPNRKLASGRFNVGENIYQYGTTANNFKFDPEMALNSWFNEYKHFQYRALENSDFGKEPAIGHYTQMAWSDSVYVGCAISEYRENNWNYFYVVCNYGPTGNYISRLPYKSGGASGQLVCGTNDCSRMYGDSC